MPYYRLYIFGADSRHIEHFREFEADDDDSAMSLAKETRGTAAMELWSGRRKVEAWGAFPASP